MKKHEGKIRVVIFKEMGMYIARCLEKNIGTQGKTIDQLLTRLENTLLTEIPYIADIPKSPKKYFTMWNAKNMQPIPAPMYLDARVRRV